MKYIFGHLKNGLQRFPSGYVYDVRDTGGRGRLCMMLSAIMTNLITNLSDGLFYTSFLLMYDMDKSKIGVLTFVPYLTSLFSLLSPYILERFPKRKWLLFGGKLAYYLIKIMGITLLPMIVTDTGSRMAWFLVFTFAANILNKIYTDGYTAWQVNFLPEHVRSDYFNTSSCISAFVTFVLTLIISYVGDLFTGTVHEAVFLTTIRYIAFSFAVVECLIWLIPKEYPYVQEHRQKFTNVITLPLKNRRFLGTVMLVALYNFVSCLPKATLNAYILEDVGVSYMLYNGINMLYFVFFFFFGKWTKNMVRKYYLFRAMTIGMLIASAYHILYGFVTGETIWIYVVVRLIEHIFGVYMATVIGSMPYVNLPENDRTCYLSFYTITVNMAIFLSMMLATVFTDWMGDRNVKILQMTFSSHQLLQFMAAVGCLFTGFVSWWNAKALTAPGAHEYKNKH